LTAQPTVADQTITAKSVSITGVTAETKSYDGTNTATLSGGEVSTGVDSETLIVTEGTGTFEDQNVGSKAVTATGYALADGTNGGLAANYSLSGQPSVANQTISERLIEITATSGQSKVFGEIDPTFTYIISNGSLVSGDALTGALERVAGETVGDYALLIGSLTAGSNYNITFVGTNFTITSGTGVYPNDLNIARIYSNAKDIFVYIPNPRSPPSS